MVDGIRTHFQSRVAIENCTIYSMLREGLQLEDSEGIRDKVSVTNTIVVEAETPIGDSIDDPSIFSNLLFSGSPDIDEGRRTGAWDIGADQRP